MQSHHRKGASVNHTTSSARTPFLRTGLLQALRGVFGGGGGSGAGSTVGVGRTSSIRALGLVAVVATAFMALSASSASATVARQYESSIIEAGGSPLVEPQGLAVDGSANLYIGDRSRAGLFKFDSTGAAVTAWGTNGQITEAEGAPFGSLYGLAVDNADDLWAADPGLAVLDKFAPTGAFPFLKQSSAEGHLSGFIQSLAFSTAAGNLFVADSNEDGLHVLDSEGAFIETIAGSEATWGEGCCFIRTAADNSAGATGGDVYVSGKGAVFRIHGSGLEKGLEAPFSETGLSYVEGAKLTGTPEGSFGNASGEQGALAMAVDSAGNLYVADRVNHRVDEFAPSGKYLGKLIGTPTGPGSASVPFGEITALGTNAATGKLYVADATAAKVDVFGPPVIVPDVTTKPPTNLTTTSATLDGEVNPAGLEVEECAFEYGLTEAYGELAPCQAPDAEELGEGNVPVPVHADIASLVPGAEYHFRLIARNENGTNKESGDQHFFTGASIDSTSVSAVTATTALLETELNPHGIPTTYHFEYDTLPYAEGEAPHGEATPTASAGSGTTDVARTAPLGALAPDTVYHFRVVATNSLGTVTGPDHTFTTQGAFASLLPDDRGWELVSPPEKHGAALEAITLEGGVIQAQAEGDAITYFASASPNPEPAGSRSAAYSQLLSARSASGWSTADLTTPHQAPVGLSPGEYSEYQLFSTDLSLGAVEPFGATPLSPLTTEKTPYLRTPDGTYDPLVTAANVPPDVHFGGVEGGPESFGLAVEFITATPDLDHILLHSPQPLTPDFKFGFEPTKENVFEWTAGTLRLASLIPPGEEPACGPAGPECSPAAEAGLGSNVGNGSAQVRNAISADGSRVVFTTGAGSSSRLWQRDLNRGETVQLDAAQEGGSGKSQGGVFQFASADGSRVFFTDEEMLTSDSTAGGLNSQEPDLYMCQIEVKEEHLSCALTDLTANTIDPSEPANVQGNLIGAAADGSSAYFVANGALVEGAVHGSCHGEAGVGACNFYRYDTASGSLQLIAVLSGADFPNWGGLVRTDLGGLTARVSPSGRYLAFMSSRPLTGYDNRDAKTGVSDQEVYLYDFQAPAGENLRCASCNPTGARPRGVLDKADFPGLLADRAVIWRRAGEQTLAANIPGWTRVDLPHALYQSRYLSDSGRLFFNAADALVPQDSNGTFDVYQFEFPQGPGQPASNDCTTASHTYSPKSGGCVSLISSGTSPEESAFMDASESGNDVFFLTSSRLTGKDLDTAPDLYDARVGGGEPEVVKPVECSGDACQQPAVPPIDATPGSLTFNGAGNVLQCPKGKVKKSGKCVAKKSKKHDKHKKSHKKHKKSKRANPNRGGAK
jgi:hypothetical protein